MVARATAVNSRRRPSVRSAKRTSCRIEVTGAFLRAGRRYDSRVPETVSPPTWRDLVPRGAPPFAQGASVRAPLTYHEYAAHVLSSHAVRGAPAGGTLG